MVLKPKINGNGSGYATLTFSQAELAPYANIACTLDLINADYGSWGWITMDNVTIPGETAPPGADKDFRKQS